MEIQSLADLLDLQIVDSEIDRLLNERQSLPALSDYRRAHGNVARIERRRDETAVALKQADLGVDKTSGELELVEQKMGAEQNRLYAGGLSARDADYMRREVEQLDAKCRKMEDEVLELMELRERKGEEMAQLEEDLAAASEEKASLEADITESWKRIDAMLAIKEQRKADIAPLIDDDLMDLYEGLRSTMDDGVVVGRLAEGVCGVCHLRLTPAEQLTAQRSDPPRCNHCRAILVT